MSTEMNVNRLHSETIKPVSKYGNRLRDLDNYFDAKMKELRHNPPKTDYVLLNGKMLPIPRNQLTSTKRVLGMYEHLHPFTHNAKVARTFYHYDHEHPIECIMHMYGYDCISIGELREILCRPLQIRLLHERFYRQELVRSSPFRRFVVEFVEMLQFMLRLQGYLEIRQPAVRRYCYSWNLMHEVTFPEKAFRNDKLAKSYETETLSSKNFIQKWSELCSMMPVKKWMYCKYQDWFLAFNEKGQVDYELTEDVLRDEVSLNRGREKQSQWADQGVVSAVRSFCGSWALTHLGTPLSEEDEGGNVMIKAERVGVVSKGYVVQSDSGKILASGFDVYLPKYCRFAAISRYSKQDFEQLVYALRCGHKHRRHTAGMPWGQMKKLLRQIEEALKHNGAPQDDIYRILKLLANQHRQAADTTMYGHGFYPPKELSSHGEIRQMSAHDAYEQTMLCTADNRDLQKSCQNIFRRFGIDGDIHMNGMADI